MISYNNVINGGKNMVLTIKKLMKEEIKHSHRIQQCLFVKTITIEIDNTEYNVNLKEINHEKVILKKGNKVEKCPK